MADEADIANDAVTANVTAIIQRNLANAAINQPGSPECEDCGEMIPQKRREIAPFARTCIECQQDREAIAKRRRH